MDLTLPQLFNYANETRDVAAGEVIFSEGEEGEHMFALLEGVVALRIRNTKVWQLAPGDLFGEMALIDTKPRSATAIAETAARLAVIDQRQFLFMVQQTPYFALQLMRVISNRLREMDQTVS